MEQNICWIGNLICNKGDISNDFQDELFNSFQATEQPCVKKDQIRSIPHNIYKDKLQMD